MRTIILLIAGIAIYLTAFINHKCDHVFTQVEQAEIKMERPNMYGTMTLPGIINTWPEYPWPSGKQEGKELICVKCFHKQKQVFDYGQPCNGLKLPDSWRGGVLTALTDTGTALFRGTLMLKGDTLIWSTDK